MNVGVESQGIDWSKCWIVSKQAGVSRSFCHVSLDICHQ